MKINQIRLSFFVALVLLIVFRHFFILPYLLPMWISLEVLNLNKQHTKDASNRYLNFIFWIYTILLIINRTRTFRFHENTEQIINIAEHFFFALIIGVKLFVYLKLLGFHMKNASLLLIVFCLNLIGLFNELFQNVTNKRDLLEFKWDSYKDMLVNLVGSLIFMMGMMWFIKVKSKRLEME